MQTVLPVKLQMERDNLYYTISLHSGVYLSWIRMYRLAVLCFPAS